MTSTEIVRLKRQMHLRIREVVAERRLARQHAQAGAGESDRRVGEGAPEHDGKALIHG